MVAVGDHDRLLGRPRPRWRRSVSGSSTRQTVWRTPSSSTTSASGALVDREQVGEALGERQAPDGGEVGPARPEQVEAVALGLLGGVLVREDVGAGRAELEGADHPGGAALDAVVVGGGHAVER